MGPFDEYEDDYEEPKPETVVADVIRQRTAPDDLAYATRARDRRQSAAGYGSALAQIVASVAGAPETYNSQPYKDLASRADQGVKDVIAERTASKEEAAAKRQSKLDELTFADADRKAEDYARKHDKTRPELQVARARIAKVGPKYGFTGDVNALDAESIEQALKYIDQAEGAETALRLGGMRVNAPPKPHALTAGQSEALSGHDAALKQLDGVDTALDQYAPMMGPIEGRARGANPYDTDAQTFDAQLKLVAQNVGKALEGGKLAEGDITRYRQMLPNLSDTPDVAKRKVEALRELVRQKQRSDIDTARRAKFDVSGFDSAPSKPPPQRTISRKQYNPRLNKTRFTYSDGTTEELDGQR